MTTTVEAPMGSEMMVKGFILDNQLTDFSFEPTRDGKPVANAAGPGKHPLSAMSPTIVLGPDGKFKYAVGSPGGPLIIDYVAQSLIGLIDGGLTPQQATAQPHPKSEQPDLARERHSARNARAAAHRDGSHGGDTVRREKRTAHHRAREGRLHRRRRSAPRWRGVGRLIFDPIASRAEFHPVVQWQKDA